MLKTRLDNIKAIIHCILPINQLNPNFLSFLKSIKTSAETDVAIVISFKKPMANNKSEDAPIKNPIKIL